MIRWFVMNLSKFRLIIDWVTALVCKQKRESKQKLLLIVSNWKGRLIEFSITFSYFYFFFYSSRRSDLRTVQVTVLHLLHLVENPCQKMATFQARVRVRLRAHKLRIGSRIRSKNWKGSKELNQKCSRSSKWQLKKWTKPKSTLTKQGKK